MHASSLENMALCVERFAPAAFLDGHGRPVRILDVGAADVNGGYRVLFRDRPVEYTGVDIEDGPGVDVVLETPDRLPFPDGHFDLVLSGQMLEHCPRFWVVFPEMARVLADHGRLFLIAPSAGPVHRYPVDCYRFLPDAYRTLAEVAGLHLAEVRRDERGPWRDLVGVFVRDAAIAPAPPPPVAAPADIAAGTPEEEATAGRRRTFDVLRQIHERLAPRLYVEIGVRHGASLALATGPAVAVDPAPALEDPVPGNVRLFEMTSDRFFREAADEAIGQPVDFALVDGMHLADFALRDVMHLERRMARCGIIAVDDVFPNHPVQAARDRRTRVWTGDVWKLAVELKRIRKDLVIVELDTAPTGLMLLMAPDPQSRHLWESYNPLVRRMLGTADAPPAGRLAREEAVDPAPERIDRLVEILLAARAAGRQPPRHQLARAVLP